jgi:hypothetical protein
MNAKHENKNIESLGFVFEGQKSLFNEVGSEARDYLFKAWPEDLVTDEHQVCAIDRHFLPMKTPARIETGIEIQVIAANGTLRFDFYETKVMNGIKVIKEDDKDRNRKSFITNLNFNSEIELIVARRSKTPSEHGNALNPKFGQCAESWNFLKTNFGSTSYGYIDVSKECSQTIYMKIRVDQEFEIFMVELNVPKIYAKTSVDLANLHVLSGWLSQAKIQMLRDRLILAVSNRVQTLKRNLIKVSISVQTILKEQKNESTKNLLAKQSFVFGENNLNVKEAIEKVFSLWPENRVDDPINPVSAQKHNVFNWHDDSIPKLQDLDLEMLLFVVSTQGSIVATSVDKGKAFERDDVAFSHDVTLNDHHRTTLGLEGAAIGRDNSTIDLEGAARTIDNALDCGDTAHIGPRAAHHVLAHDVKGEMRHRHGTASDGVVHEGDELIDKSISQDRATHEDKSHSEKYTMHAVNAGQDVSPHCLDGATRDLVGASHDIEATVNFDGAAKTFSEVTHEIDASSVCLDEVDPYCPTQDHEVAVLDDSLRGCQSAPYDSYGAAISASAHKCKCAVQDVDDVVCGCADQDGHGSTRDKNGATRSDSIRSDDDPSYGDSATHTKNDQAQDGEARKISDSCRNENEAAHTDSTQDVDATARNDPAREDVGAMHDDGGPVDHETACDETAHDDEGAMHRGYGLVHDGAANSRDDSVCFNVELSKTVELLATIGNNFYLDSINPRMHDEKLPRDFATKTTSKIEFSLCCSLFWNTEKCWAIKKSIL